MKSEKIYWGSETRKAVENFGRGVLPPDFIRAFAEVKKAALLASLEFDAPGDPLIRESLIKAVDQVISGEFNSQFPVPLRQGSAGTSINMNFNEVIASLAEEYYLEKSGLTVLFDPIERVNRFQSTNDVFPTAVTVFVYRHLEQVEELVIRLQEILITKENEYGDILMAGRTELQSALPVTLGQVFGGWAGSVERDRWRLNKLKERIRSIALGGTAIGTCYFAPGRYVFLAEQKLREITGLPLSRSQNLIDEISNQDKLAELAAGYNLVALNLSKICGDLLLYTSSLAGELSHPELQYGSTIMPAKTNPVILELVKGLALDIQGECSKIALFCQNGQLQLNPYLPFMTASLGRIFEDIRHGINALVEGFLLKMEVRRERIEENLLRSNILLNLLIPVLGYNRVKELYRKVGQWGSVDELKDFVSRETALSRDELDHYFNPGTATSYFRKF